MTLQEMLQKRADFIQKQRDILEAGKASGEITEEQEQKFQEYQKEIEKLDSLIEKEKSVSSREEGLDDPATKRFRPGQIDAGYKQQKKLNDAGFKNLGEFIHAIRFGDAKGRLAELPVGQGQGGGYAVPDAFKGQLMPHTKDWSMGTDANGGYAVPPQFDVSQIWMLNPERSIVRPRATVIPAGDPPDAALNMPALNQGNNGVFGGVEVQWIGEGVEKPDTNGTLREITLQPNEVAASTVVTDKLLRNWQAASSFIGNLLSQAMYAAEDIAFLTGNGTGKPTGVIGATGAKVVNRKTASQVAYEDIVNMLAALYAESMPSAVWIANQTVLPQIATMQDPGGRYIYIGGDATKAIPATLAGLPILFTGRTPVLGTKGDLILVDFQNYLIKDGSGPFIAASEHVLFKQNKTVIKVFWNVDGKPWVNAPLLLEDGNTTVSPYVVLDVPSTP